jgi:hypothetical protein
MIAVGLVAMASMMVVPATSASSAPSVTGLYKYTSLYAGSSSSGPLVLYPSGEVMVFSDVGKWSYNGVEIIMVFDISGCVQELVGEGNPTAGFGGTGGEGPVGACFGAPYGNTWSMKKA